MSLFSIPHLRPALAALLAAALLPLMAGCESTPPAPTPTPAPVIREVRVPVEVRIATPVPSVEPADASGRQLLAWMDALRPMAPDALAAEIARLGEGGTGTPAQAMHLALALGQSRNAGDAARAYGLLDQIIRSTAPDAAPWQGWARLLAPRFQEQRRLEEQVERQAAQLRDGQRQRDQLNEKIEALRAIERSLTRPPSAGSSPK